MIKFTPKLIGPLNNPIIIVGEKPNTTRDGSTQSLVGNRTGDFVAEAIGDRTNIILTNVVNLLYSGKFDHNIGVADGVLEIIELIDTYQPRKIICLGGIARVYVDSIVSDCSKAYLRHPQWINRFRFKERSIYIKTLQNELDK